MITLNNYQEVIVVEGKNDYNKLISIFPNMQIITTNGSALDSLDTLKEIAKRKTLILFLDPDYPGEKIRKTIANEISNVKHAFLNRKDAISKNHKKIGIEHASKEAIINSLENVLTMHNLTTKIKMSQLIDLNLIGNKSSSNLRSTVSEILHLGKTNAKTFLYRINLFGITIAQIEEVIKNENKRNHS